MPIVIGALAYLLSVFRRPIDPRLKRRRVGGSLIVGLAGAAIVMWDRSAPGDVTTAYLWAEIGGVLAVYLMAWSLVLATRARWLERWFGGLDRMYLWHKRTAIMATLLLLPHAVVAKSGAEAHPGSQLGNALGIVSLFGLLALVAISLPRVGRILRLPYERWLFVHRLIGVLFAIAVVHGLLVDHIIGSSVTLKLVFSGVAVIGTGAYAYDELLRRRLAPHAGYEVRSVARPSGEIVELNLSPSRSHAISPRAGQFVFLRIGGERTWREHPFSIASADPDGSIRLSVRAAGKETSRMHAELEPGTPASVSGPYGMFDFTLGGERQVWVAGGIGIVPFLSWMHQMTPADDRHVEMFYCVPTEADAVYLSELRAHAARLRYLQVHLFTRARGRLKGVHITEALEGTLAGTHVFLCGSPPLVDGLSRDLRRGGLTRDYIHAEQFGFR